MTTEKGIMQETYSGQLENDWRYDRGELERDERPPQISYHKTDYPEAQYHFPHDSFRSDSELGSIHREIRDKINEMFHVNGFPGLRFRMAKEYEYTVDFEELALSIAQLLSEISKREKIIQDLQSEKNTVVQKFSGHKERQECSLKQKVHDLEEIIELKEKELGLSYSNIKELQLQLEGKQSTHPVYNVPPASAKTELEKRLDVLMEDNDKLFKENQTLTLSLYEAKQACEDLGINMESYRAPDSRLERTDPSLKEELEILKVKLAKLEDYNHTLSRDLDTLKEVRSASKEPSQTLNAPVSQKKSHKTSTGSLILDRVKEILNVKTDKQLIQVAKQTGELLPAIRRMEAFIREVCIIVQKTEELEIKTEKDFGRIIEKALPILKQWSQDRQEYKLLLSFRKELVSLLNSAQGNALPEREMTRLFEEIRRLLPKS